MSDSQFRRYLDEFRKIVESNNVGENVDISDEALIQKIEDAPTEEYFDQKQTSILDQIGQSKKIAKKIQRQFKLTA